MGKLVKLFSVLLACATMFFVACSDDDKDDVGSVVGTFEVRFTDDGEQMREIFTFNAGGNGVYRGYEGGEGETDYFTWTQNGNQINIKWSWGESETFTFTGNTIVGRGRTYAKV